MRPIPNSSDLKAAQHQVAGHEGAMEDESGSLFIKPCTQAEIDFYQSTMFQHPEFYEMMPEFVGTLSLGPPYEVNDQVADESTTSEKTGPAPTASATDPRSYGRKIETRTAIVLDHLEHRFTHPNVLDIKLGSKLWADGTTVEKAARLDKVAAETTSGSLNFRITGMKVWNGHEYEKYDKSYGRKFSEATVIDGFQTFFAGLQVATPAHEYQAILQSLRANIARLTKYLESTESRMYGASLLIVYEGDAAVLREVLHDETASQTDVAAQASADDAEQDEDDLHRNDKNISVGVHTHNSASGHEAGEDDEDEEDEEVDDDGEQPQLSHCVKMIDFAHSEWTPGLGADMNVITGLRNVAVHIERLLMF